jgi:hypothetical protein
LGCARTAESSIRNNGITTHFTHEAALQKGGSAKVVTEIAAALLDAGPTLTQEMNLAARLYSSHAVMMTA